MAGDCGSKLRKRWLAGRVPGRDRIERLVVPVERTRAHHRRQVALVGKIVSGAGETVDGDDRRPQAARNEEARDRKVFVMGDGHAEAGAMSR